MTRVLYPGSFDPFHNGHLEIVEVGASLFDEVVVAIVGNPQKASALFDFESREAMIAESVEHLGNVSVISSAGLVVDLARASHVDFVLKGLRGSGDLDAEMQMALMNKAVSGVETLFLPAGAQYSFVASKYIRDITRLGGDATHLVPDPVAQRLRK
ncbi:MAG: pantetheine-phosphate adenylyltransferase [Acidimicrobiales bacterium]